MRTLEERLHSYEPLFGSWALQGEIGSGSYARVYRVVHRDQFGMVLESALKAIEIIPEGTIENVKNLEALVRDQYVGEVNLMGAMRGISNIVSYEDHAIMKIVENGKVIGYDLLIRMELLKSLDDILRSDEEHHLYTEDGVRKLGMDLCRGLSRCHRVGILHRDIKPKNIFMNRFGDYKLGDFGIARHLEGTMYARTRIGTEMYVAPEVKNNWSSKYDSRADLYSLGLVLYQFANQGCIPFMTPNMPRSKWKDAIDQRNRGDEFDLPCGVSEALGEVIVKACAFRPEDRYASAQEMYHALQSARKRETVVVQKKQEIQTAETRDTLGKMWSQFGLSVVSTPEQRYIRQCLEQSCFGSPHVARDRKVAGLLTVEQAQKLPRWRTRIGLGEKQLNLDRYQEIANWAFRGRKDLSSVSCTAHVRKIGEESFADCTGLQELRLGPPLQQLGPAAFARCTKIKTVELPSSLERMGDRAFQDCSALEAVSVADGFKELPVQAFAGCRSLSQLRLPMGLERIGAEAFAGCNALTEMILPETVSSIGQKAFYGCKGLQELYLPTQLQSLPNACFMGCTELYMIRFSHGLQYIEPQAFCQCSSLVSAELPYGLLKIGSEAFADCENLMHVKVPDTVMVIGTDAFGTGGSRILRGRFSKLTVIASKGSYAWDYCRQNGIRVEES